MRFRQILDPAHGYIRVPPQLDDVLDSPAIQRLRRVSQTALMSTVYPSANGSRFEHALGAMHLAGIAFSNAWDNTKDEDTRQKLLNGVRQLSPGLLTSPSENKAVLERAVAAVGLLHDVGHPPFSHALESFFQQNAAEIFKDTPQFRELLLHERRTKPFHELAGQTIVEHLRDRFRHSDEFKLFFQIYTSDPDESGWASALHSIVASTIDIDRLDYIIRDSHHAGTEYGKVDLNRLITAMEFRLNEDNEVRLSLGLRARSAAELLLVQRMQATRWMYKHPRVVAVESLLRRALHELQSIKSASFQSEADRWAAEAIRKLTPPLNYVRQSSSYRISGLAITDALGHEDSQEDAATLQIPLPFEIPVPDEAIRRDPSRSVFSEIQLSVTDDVVLRYCSNSAICCRAAIDKGAKAEELQQFLHYYDVSLRRSSALVILCKRHEEYASLARDVHSHARLQPYLDECVESAQQLAENTIPPDERESFLHNVMQLRRDPLLFLNYLGYILFPEGLPTLNTQLTNEHSKVAGVSGIWHCEFAPTRNPLHSMTSNVRLEGERGTSVSLRATSPLVASIEEVEKRATMLHVFFLLTARDKDVSEHLTRSELRQRLREAFVEFFPLFIDQELSGELSLGIRASLMEFARVRDEMEKGNRAD